MKQSIMKLFIENRELIMNSLPWKSQQYITNTELTLNSLIKQRLHQVRAGEEGEDIDFRRHRDNYNKVYEMLTEFLKPHVNLYTKPHQTPKQLIRIPNDILPKETYGRNKVVF